MKNVLVLLVVLVVMLGFAQAASDTDQLEMRLKQALSRKKKRGTPRDPSACVKGTSDACPAQCFSSQKALDTALGKKKKSSKTEPDMLCFLRRLWEIDCLCGGGYIRSGEELKCIPEAECQFKSEFGFIAVSEVKDLDIK